MRINKILVDCDGVLSNMLGACVPHSPALRALLSTEISRNKVLYHDAFAHLPKHEEDALWDYINTTRSFVKNMPEMPATNMFLSALRSYCVELVCVTSPAYTSPYWVPERFHWLKRRGFESKQVVFTKGKEHVSGDVFIDDHPNHVKNWAAQHPDGVALLWHEPSYLPPELPATENIWAVSSLADITEHLEAFYRR